MRTADRLLRRVVPVMFDRDQLLPETRRRSGHHLRRRFGRGAADKSGGSGLRAGNAAVPRAGRERHPPLWRPGFLFAVASAAGVSLARLSGLASWCYIAGRRLLSPLPESETHHQRNDAQKSNRSVSNSAIPSGSFAQAAAGECRSPRKPRHQRRRSIAPRPVHRGGFDLLIGSEGAILELLGKGNPRLQAFVRAKRRKKSAAGRLARLDGRHATGSAKARPSTTHRSASKRPRRRPGRFQRANPFKALNWRH